MAFTFLKGKELIEVLSHTQHVVKLMNCATGGLIGTITPATAINMVKASTYVGKCSPRRCYNLKEVDERKPAVWIPAHRNDRPVLPVYSVTTRTVDLWDRYFEAERKKAKVVAGA